MRAWLYLLCFAFPIYTLVYCSTGPHPGPVVWLWLLPIAAAIAVDALARPERSPPPPLPPWPFDAALFLLAGLQLLNLTAWIRLVAGGISWTELGVGGFLVGTSSGYSAIVVAHELVHRKSPWFRETGRLLLASVLYEHFATEHVRGHHRRVGTAEDPATARFGERLPSFLARTVPGQLRSAWRLECRRLGAEEMSPLDRRQLGNRVLHGALVGWGAAAAIGLALGPVALIAWLEQAAWAILLLETVNYVEHWGIVRVGPRVRPVDSWDSESWFTYYTLVGLSRHADHHANAARPWQDLRAFDESPKMPWGYWATVICALVWPPAVRRRMSAELLRRGLGPWATHAG